jgi:hypothetical protein
MVRGFALASLGCAIATTPVLAQTGAPSDASPQSGVASSATAPTVTIETSQQPGDISETTSGPDTDIFSKNTLSVLLDARLVVANGEKSFVNGGYGKTRFSGTRDGNYRAQFVPAEADLVWEPRFTKSLSANVSAAYQRDHDHRFDLIEAFVSYLPESSSKFSFSGRAGLMWPEISLEHSTGGAWSVVNTITPSAINSWVGEETKVIGVEGTLHANLGEHVITATGGVFGFNDTSGTLLSFRGWALHDEKATAFGHFPLPPLNNFIGLIQAEKTRNTLDADHQPGYYLRLDWRPPWPFGIAVFYYDNRGDPTKFIVDTLQWGWRTRFVNIGLNADLGPNTKLLAQGMSGSTIMGFKENGVPWVHTFFRSAYVLVTQQLTDKAAVTGRVETFGTREHGSEMDPRLDDENGWAVTAALRYSITSSLTGFLEALNVRSKRGMRVVDGISPFQAQTVFQASLRFRI